MSDYTDEHAQAGVDAQLSAIETWPNQYPNYTIKIEIPEYTSVCPKTGLPDHGKITIEYEPDKLCAELKSLKMYLLEYRNLGIFYENAVNRILRDIVAGVTEPATLATHRDYRCRASEEKIAASLTGNYRAEHLFALRQNLELFDTIQRQIQDCDGEIESLLQRLAPKQRKSERALPPPRYKFRHCDNEPRFDVRDPLFRLSGVDLTQIDGIGPFTALQLIAEIGTDMTRWPTYKHFTSWLTLAPKNKISGARLISSRTQPSANKAAGLLRMSAMVLGRTSTALGAYYRRIAYRIGKPKAITATARKLAILVYRTLKGELHYADPGAAAYEEQHRQRTLRNVRNRAKRLGLGLVDLETGELLQGAVT